MITFFCMFVLIPLAAVYSLVTLSSSIVLIDMFIREQ